MIGTKKKECVFWLLQPIMEGRTSAKDLADYSRDKVYRLEPVIHQWQKEGLPMDELSWS
jgi:hypothetical protein